MLKLWQGVICYTTIVNEYWASVAKWKPLVFACSVLTQQGLPTVTRTQQNLKFKIEAMPHYLYRKTSNVVPTIRPMSYDCMVLSVALFLQCNSYIQSPEEVKLQIEELHEFILCLCYFQLVNTIVN